MVEPIGAVRDTQTYSIIGAAMEVHRVFGCGFLEAPYSAALKVELHLRGIPFAAEVSFPLRYKGQSLALAYRPDLICFGSIIVEGESALITRRAPIRARDQLPSRLRFLRRALVLNFGTTSLGYKRLVFGLDPSQLSIPPDP